MAKPAHDKPAAKKPAPRTPATPRPAAPVAASGEAPTRVQSFDRGAYDPLPIMDLAEAIAMVTALLAAKPADAPAAALEEAERMSAVRDHAQTVLQSHLTPAASVDVRPYDVSEDRAWGTFVRRIRDFAQLSLERHPQAARAAEVYAVVRDLSILKLEFRAEYAQINARLDLLDKRGMLADARAFAGGEFLDEVTFAHAAYGKALGITHTLEASAQSPADRNEARRMVTESIDEYVHQWLPQARAGRPETWEAVTHALLPIVALRERQAKAASRPAATPKVPTPG